MPVLAQSQTPNPCPGEAEGNSLEVPAAATALADGTLGAADKLTDGLRIPGIDLGALKFVGGITTGLSLYFSGASLRSNWQQGNWVGVGVNVVDLTAPVVAFAFPPAAPLVIAYGIGRATGDLGVSLYNAHQSQTCHH
jgi:hypothetical protein